MLDTKYIVDCLKTNYNINIKSIQNLAMGADMHASVYKVQAEDSRCYFIKVKGSYDQNISLAITHLLHEVGMKQIILPIKTIQNLPAQRIDGYTLIVYPFIEGEDGFCRKLTREQWFVLGKALKQIHEVKLPPLLQSHIKHETYSNKWRQLIKSLLVSDEVNIILDFLKKNKATINKLIDNADELCMKIKKQSDKFVLCHSDIHGGNVLIDNQNDIYIVDWDDPILAPKERDLMFIGGGIGNVWNDPLEEQYFFEGYGNTAVNKIMLAYYRHERIVIDIAEFYQVLLEASLQDAKRQIIYKQFTDMFEPQGVVEIAFRTYEWLR